MAQNSSRRTFVKTAATALAAAPGILQAQGANDRLNFGWIGGGSRGNYLTERFFVANIPNAQIGYVCDAYDGHVARAIDRVQTMGGNTPKSTKDYHDILADDSIDAVVIATPEHLHQKMTLEALAAGKHIYVEKPLAHTIEEGEEVLAAARKSDRVIQVGTQNRSNSLYHMAKDMISQGYIGEVHYVRAFWYRNSLPTNPAWRYNIPGDAAPSNTDWEAFLGPAQKRPFDKRRFYQWRLYWDYSGGISTDLLVHQTDITNFVCGKRLPLSCMASGGIYRWTDPEDDREVPDCLSAVYEYPGKFQINYSCYFGNNHFSYGEQFMGNEGTIEVIGRQYLNFYPEAFGGNQPPHVAARKELKMYLPRNDNDAVEAHLKNWAMAIRGEEQLIAPVEIGQEAAIGGHMATLSYRNGKKVLWDNEARKYSFV
jgi:predicted dehydrogenase